MRFHEATEKRFNDRLGIWLMHCLLAQVHGSCKWDAEQCIASVVRRAHKGKLYRYMRPCSRIAKVIAQLRDDLSVSDPHL